MHHEQEYLDERAAQWRFSRRRLLALGAAAVPALADRGPSELARAAPSPTGRSSSRCRRSGSSSSARTRRCAGTRCATGLPRPERAVLRAQPHRDAGDRRRRPGGCEVFGTRPARRPRRRQFSLRDLLPAARAERSPRPSSAPATAAASSPASRARRRPGTAWQLGAIGVAALARRAAARRARARRPRAAAPSTCMPEGLDATVVTGGVDHGHVRRPLPVGKALDDVLLAYEMNGEPLPPDHGLPVRAGRAGLDRHRERSSGWAASRSPTAPLFSPWNTDVVPADRARLPARRAAAHRAGGQERVRAAVGRRACRAGRRVAC